MMSLVGLKPLFDQPPYRFRADGLRVGLAFDPGGELRLQLDGDAQALSRGFTGPRAAAGSFFKIGY